MTRKLLYLRGLCILSLVAMASTIPVTPLRRSTEEKSRIIDPSLSNTPKIVEIQLPLKLASKEDLVAWAKYVMGLMASRINITLSNVRDSMSRETDGIIKPADMSKLPLEPFTNKPALNIQIAGVKPNRLINGQFTDPRVNFQVSSIQDVNAGSAFGTKGVVTAPEFLPRYADLTRRPEVPRELSRTSNAPEPPSNAYLPLPVKAGMSARFINDMFSNGRTFEGTTGNRTRIESPTTSLDSITRKTISNAPLINEGDSKSKNESNADRPILTLPFEAVITIAKEEKPESLNFPRQTGNYPIRDPPDEFPPYFEKNYTVTNESGQVNVIFEDVGDDLDRKVEDTEPKKERSKKERSQKEKLGNRPPVDLQKIIKMLENLRRPRDDELPTRLTPPGSKVKTKSQRVQLAEQKDDVAKDRRNGTSQAQELEDDYDDENGGMGGSIQSILELLPLVAPILEDLSDPNSETDVVELLQAALPILEGLFEGDGEGPAPDLPGLIVPILLNVIRGRDGQGSNANDLLGPLIQLGAPFIGPIIGPLIGPLIQQSSNDPGEGSNFGTLVQAFVGPLSTPTGPGKMSPFSTVVAGVVSSLSKELLKGDSGIDLKSLVSMVVSGTIWGASAALSGPKDNAYAPTSYGGDKGYGGYGVPANSVNPFTLIGSSIKDILTSVLKVSTSLIQALSAILGASSQPKPYGPPTGYGPPTSYQNQNYQATTRAPQSQRNRATRRPSAG